MKRSVFRSFAVALAVGMLSAVSAVVSTVVDFGHAVYCRGRQLFADFGDHLARKLTAQAEESGNRGPAVLFIKAEQFAVRILKRERPTVTPTWRMCPSI